MISFLKEYLPETPVETSFQKPETAPVISEPSSEDNVSSMVSSLIDNILKDISPDSSREERVEKIRFMDSRGIFLVKGSVEQVAAKMGIGKVTVYSYLDEVHGKKR